MEVRDMIGRAGQDIEEGDKIFLATATPMNLGICKCDECEEIMLEDERHWHKYIGSKRQLRDLGEL
jgi:hypothetical protein